MAGFVAYDDPTRLLGGVMKTIVVGTDGSDTSFQAVAQAATLAAATGGTLHIAYVVDTSTVLAASALAPVGGIPVVTDSEMHGEAEATLARARDVAAGLSASTEAHVLDGEPSRELNRLCEALSADLLVVGSRGMKGAARFVLGSVPNRVAHHAPCSVLIVRTT